MNEPKLIVKVEQRMHGHLAVEFEDRTWKQFLRGEHEKLSLKVGDYWPPRPPAATRRAKKAA